MSVRAPAIALAISALGLLNVVGASMATGPSVEFQDGAGNPVDSLGVYDTVTLYISSAALGTVATGTATWTGTEAPVPAPSPWSLATGQPEVGAFALSAAGYDTTTPANTPLYAAPTATVNGSPVLLNDCNALAGDLSLVNAVSADSTLQVAFTYYTLDSYTAGQRRARVTSTSDALGEWVSIGAVVSVSGVGVCPVLGLYPPPGLFSGEVLLSDNVATAGDGDGYVWVRHGDALTVTYYDTDGVTPVDTHQVSVTLPSPPPAPGAGWLALVVLGTLFVLARVAVSRRRPAPSAAGTGVPPP